MAAKKIKTPLSDDVVWSLRAGDNVLLSGVVYTARDAAHMKLAELLERGEEFPFPMEGAVIYYVGPSPAKPGKPIGSAGPTTSYRMDPYAPALIERGLKGMIGKGERGDKVVDAMKHYGAVYFAATGGAAALIANSIKEAEVIAYPELGAEAIRRIVVEDFPVIVAQDAFGANLYRSERKKYEK